MGLIKWLKRKLDDGGHFHIGNRITVYWGNNAMHWAVNIYTKKYGYICAHPRTKAEPAYFYLSPNATPWASTFYIGSDKDEYVRSRIRKTCFGHNFSLDEFDDNYGMKNREILRGINRSIEYSKYQYVKYQRENPEND